MNSLLYNANRMLMQDILHEGGGSSPPPSQNPSKGTGGGKTAENAPLSEGYKELLKELEKTDKKYSTNYQAPKTDLPSSLGTEKVTYVMPTQEEIEKQAKEQLESDYISKKSSVEQKRQKGEDSIANSVTKAQYESMLKKLKAEQALPEEKEAALNKAVEQGLARSSISKGMQEKAQEEYEEEVENIAAQENADKAVLAQQLQQLREQTEEALKAISNMYDADVVEKVSKLLNDALKQKQNALEYNNSLEAAESRYKITRQNALTAAEKEERQRLAELQKLYEQLGKSGVQQKAQLEKYIQAKAFFDTLSPKDAKELLKASAALQYYLGDYYAAFADYINKK